MGKGALRLEEKVTSKDNPQVKLLRGLLQSKKAREEAGSFAVEGARLAADAAGSGVRIRTLLLTEAAADSQYAQTALAVAERVVWLEEHLAARLGDTRTPQGIFAVCQTLDKGRSAVTIKNGGQYLLLSSVRDPGNLGSALRSAEAFGVDGVLVSPDCADLYSPKVIRASMGGLFRLSVEEADLGEAIARLRKASTPVYGAALTDRAVPVGDVDFGEGGAVVIGNEGAGIPEEILAACDGEIIIPMTGGAESLSAPIAAAILLWEMQRSRNGGDRS